MTQSPVLSQTEPSYLHPLFSTYPALEKSLHGQVRKKQFGHGESVISHGDGAAHLWLVLAGWLKLSRQTPDGKETIVGLCTAGDIFGEAALFANANYPYTVEAIGKQVELAAISASAIRARVEKDSKLSAHIMSMLSERNAQTQLKLEHIHTMSAAQRLACFLLRLCASQASGARSLHIPVEKHVLAAYLGMKPETLSRSQQQLKPLGIQISGERVEIQYIDRLREFVCGSCSESGMGSCEGEN